MNEPYLIIPDIDAESMSIVSEGVDLISHEDGSLTINKIEDEGWVNLPILTEWGKVEMKNLEDYVLEFKADLKDGIELFMTIEHDAQGKNAEKMEPTEIELDGDFKYTLEEMGVEEFVCTKIAISGDFGEGITIHRLAFVPKDYEIPEKTKRFHLIPKANWRGREKSLQDMYYFNPPDIEENDVVLVRPIPENYTEKELKALDKDIKPYKIKGCCIYNTPDQIIKAHFKHYTMRFWDEIELNIPLWAEVKCEEDIVEFLERTNLKKALLKEVDGHSSKGQKVISKRDLVLDKINFDKRYIVSEIIRTDKYYDIIGKAYVTNGRMHDTHGYIQFRMSNEDLARRKINNYEHFLLAMKIVDKASQVFQKDIVDSVRGICDTASVDFMIKEEEIVFLEINPYWGSGNQWGTRWPNNKIFEENLLKEKGLGSMKTRVDEYNMWKRYYNNLNKFNSGGKKRKQ